MATSAWAVIGAGYGDEGKGLMTDALANALGPGTLAVRSNGGAQAGHSVQTPDGRRHVFHHVGSGALAGAATHLSRFFVHHPMMLGDEVRRLERLDACTRITADPRGYVTTPWDMLVNQLVEQARGDGRHGSCGFGFGETVGRCEETGFGLTVADLAATGLRAQLAAIRDQWLPERLACLGVSHVAAPNRELMRSDTLLDRYMRDCADFLASVSIAPDASLAAASALIFEGAQGLMLDQEDGAFPYVTRSHTGIRNMLAVAAEAGLQRIDAVYTTRCYLTRHGRGPMPNEGDISSHFRISDPTNVPNPWQERLRFGELDLDAFGGAVMRDLRHAASSPCLVVPHLAVTCLDQAAGPIPYRQGGRRAQADVATFLSAAASAMKAWQVATARGPTRATACVRSLLGEMLLAA